MPNRPLQHRCRGHHVRGRLLDPGTYSAAGSDGSDDCEACEAGQYDHDSATPTEDGGRASTPCEPCPSGRYSSAVQRLCDGQCATGTYSAPGSTTSDDCQACPGGQYDDDEDPSTECVVCGRDSFTTSATSCVPCASDTFSAPGSTECGTCAAGESHVSAEDDGSGATCQQCVAGRYDHDQSAGTACQPCPIGFYSSAVGATSCIACPDGLISAPGSTQEADCTADPVYVACMEDRASVSDARDLTGPSLSMGEDASIATCEDFCAGYASWPSVCLDLLLRQLIRLVRPASRCCLWYCCR